MPFKFKCLNKVLPSFFNRIFITSMVLSFAAVVSKESKRAPATRQMKVSQEKTRLCQA